MRQVCHRLLGAREETAEVQLDRFREHMRVRGVSAEDGERSPDVAYLRDRERHVRDAFSRYIKYQRVSRNEKQMIRWPICENNFL